MRLCMGMTLLLNATYELCGSSIGKGDELLWQGKVEVLEVYDREVHAVSISISLLRHAAPEAGSAQGHSSGGQIPRINIFRDSYAASIVVTSFGRRN